MAAAIMAIVLALGASIAAPGSGSWATSTMQRQECIAVPEQFNQRFGIGRSAAVKQEVAKQEGGLGDGGTVWFISTADGATWITEIDPATPDQAGLFLPLNEKAKTASQVGADATIAASIYRGFDDNSAGTIASRECAAGTNPAPPSTIEVPDVVGENAAAAEDRLKKLGFQRIEFGSGDADRSLVIVPANWTVLKQSPPAGAMITPDTLIVLTCTKE